MSIAEIKYEILGAGGCFKTKSTKNKNDYKHLPSKIYEIPNEIHSSNNSARWWK